MKLEKLSNEIPRVGVAESLHSLGLAYGEGVYVERNYALAADYYEKAVKLNYPNSANNLGILFHILYTVNIGI